MVRLFIFGATRYLNLEPCFRITRMASGTVAYNNGRIYYEVTGTGAPIVFIHGFTLDHRMWQPQVEAFGQSHQVIAYDARGFGKSSLPDGPYDHAGDL